ncbi:MAG: hypothetical protein GKR93_16465 [Gammaproteobacteria bacterium]|nr:hypothetical protein [Gammaproteobacteria bacterium]
MKQLIICLYLSLLTPIAFAAPKPIQHVVFCWLAEDHSPADVEAVKAGFAAFSSIPQIANMVIGAPLPSERDIVDDSFHVGVVMEFNKAEDLEAFMVDETHKKITTEVLAPLCPRAVVYDIIE